MIINDNNYHGDDLGDDDLSDDYEDRFCTQTLGAGSVEEHLAFQARYEFVTITKVNYDNHHQHHHRHTDIEA